MACRNNGSSEKWDVTDTQMLSINVQELCSGPRFYFQPYDSAEKRTMIDHVIAPLCLSDLFTSCEIADDHEPIHLTTDLSFRIYL